MQKSFFLMACSWAICDPFQRLANLRSSLAALRRPIFRIVIRLFWLCGQFIPSKISNSASLTGYFIIRAYVSNCSFYACTCMILKLNILDRLWCILIMPWLSFFIQVRITRILSGIKTEIWCIHFECCVAAAETCTSKLRRTHNRATVRIIFHWKSNIPDISQVLARPLRSENRTNVASLPHAHEEKKLSSWSSCKEFVSIRSSSFANSVKL